MAFAFGLLHELPPSQESKPRVLKIVTCIAKFPACTCCIFFFIPILLSLIGVRVLVQNAGPMGPFKIGIDYDTTHLIAKNVDALALARKESALAWLGT